MPELPSSHPTVDPPAQPPLEPGERGATDPWGDAAAPEWHERIGLVLDGLGWSPAKAALLLLGLVAAGWLAWSTLRPSPPAPELTLPQVSTTTTPAASSSTTAAATEVVVHAAGAVARPGLYHLPVAARVADLLEVAGGLTAAADVSRVNLAAPLADGQRVYVLGVGEPAAPPVEGPAGAGPPASPDDGDADEAAMVNINTADAAELEDLPGVGPVTAEAIIAHRDEHGPFTTVDQLLDVNGIGDAKLAAMRDRVTV